MWLIFVYLSFLISVYSDTDSPIVETRDGKVKGAIRTLLDGSPYYSFKGIPYAAPPVGKLRFKAPLPRQPWTGVRDAIEHGPVCPQFDVSTLKYVEGNEDCLFLNIYTKSLNPSSKIPVMVFIHGGGYASGSGNAETGFGPEFLVQHDVILVTINYRLEVLGFISLDTSEVPGNAGVKDQVAALRWVQKNIAKFGGDPDNVTLFGESAGSSAVTCHLLSPISKGLFQKVIAESGVCIQDWALSKFAKERAFKVGQLLGLTTTNTTELLEFLQSVPPLNLTNLFTQTATPDESLRGLPRSFAPIVEKRFKNVQSFLDQEPMDLLVSGKINKVPLLLGFNSAEGILMLFDTVNKLNFTNKNPNYLIPHDIAEKLNYNNETLTAMGERVIKYYSGRNMFTSNDSEAIVNMTTDAYFLYNTHRFAYLYSQLAKVYMYEFSYDTDLNFVKRALNITDIKGACHADELFYIFYSPLNQGPYEEQDALKVAAYRVSKIWADFAKTGNPTPDRSLGVKWPRYTAKCKEYLNINEQVSIGKYAEQERTNLWNKLYCEAGLPCIHHHEHHHHHHGH